MFYIPEGVDELYYPEVNEVGEPDEEIIVNVDVDEFGDPPVDDTDHPETPDILSMVNPQTLRRLDTGAEVVDVVFEVEDIAGVTNYEVRVTKA